MAEPPSSPGADCAIAVGVLLDKLLHELRRAQIEPIFHIHKGGIAPFHALALAFGWLRPLAADPRILVLTRAGRAALHDAATGLREGAREEPARPAAARRAAGARRARGARAAAGAGQAAGLAGAAG